MSEPLGHSNPNLDPDAWYPSEAELAQFEAARNERLLPDRPIEEFTADKEAGPTPEEVEAWRLWNRDMNYYPYKDMTFEAFFGRPDPRTQHRPEADDGPSRSS